MADYAVCQGATCSCTQGSATASLTVTSQTLAKIANNLVATVNDYIAYTNLPAFGNCTILTSAANGVSQPCVPAAAAPWSPGSELQQINGFAVLTKSCTLACSIGGSISISDPNNELEQTA